MPEPTVDVRYRLLRFLAGNPECSQREIARHLGFSLGKVNYCIRALMTVGWVKISNFKNSRNKRAYGYLLTPKGVRHKALVTFQFLQDKVAAYDCLAEEIEALRRELGDDAGSVRSQTIEADKEANVHR